MAFIYITGQGVFKDAQLLNGSRTQHRKCHFGMSAMQARENQSCSTIGKKIRGVSSEPLGVCVGKKRKGVLV